MKNEEEKKITKYEGGCLCRETTFIAMGDPSNPHICSCTMCQRSSGAPTVAWVEFPFETFEWNGKQPGLYQSSAKTKRCFCQKCGGLLGAINEGYPNISITIASLNNPDLIVPGEQHSYKESAPSWWDPHILRD